MGTQNKVNFDNYHLKIKIAFSNTYRKKKKTNAHHKTFSIFQPCQVTMEEQCLLVCTLNYSWLKQALISKSTYPLSAGITLPTALAAPVEAGMMF